MFGTYNVISLVVLLNMLIAMMNNSYQLIAVSSFALPGWLTLQGWLQEESCWHGAHQKLNETVFLNYFALTLPVVRLNYFFPR